MDIVFKSRPETHFLLKKALHEDDVDKFRRLKALAAQAKDHEREQEFFAMELRAKRFYETKSCMGLMTSILYQTFSDFGRSFMWPSLLLIAVFLVFGGGFWLSATCSSAEISQGFRLSASVIMPFTASAKAAFTGAQTALYGQADQMSLVFDFAVIFEGLLSLACVFLIGLALRNRFKI